MKTKIFTFLIILSLFASNFVYFETAFANSPADILGETAVLIETNTGKILFEKNSNKIMYPAGITKILTALVLLDHFSPEDVIVVGDEINQVIGSKTGHFFGETLSIKMLIRSILIGAGNDSANVAVSAIAKKFTNNQGLTFEDSEKIFANIVNKKALALDAKNTNFITAHGIHDPQHYTTAEDMAKFAVEAMKNDVIKGIVSEKEFSGTSIDGVDVDIPDIQTKTYTFTNDNLMLFDDSEFYYEYATGFKTGYTDEAGYCIVSTATKDDIDFVAVVLKSLAPARWTDAKKLLEYGFSSYSYIKLYDNNEVVANVALEGADSESGETLEIVTKDSYSLYMSLEESQKIDVVIDYTYENTKKLGVVRLTAPIAKDQEVGVASFYLDEKLLHKTKVYAADDVVKSSIFKSISNVIKKNFISVNGVYLLLFIIFIFIMINYFATLKRARNSRSYQLDKKSARRKRIR